MYGNVGECEKLHLFLSFWLCDLLMLLCLHNVVFHAATPYALPTVSTVKDRFSLPGCAVIIDEVMESTESNSEYLLDPITIAIATI